MNTLLRMAWLNLWRNKRRGAILLCAMVVGLVGVLFWMGLVNGWIDTMIEGAVQTYEGHVKVMAAGYYENPVIEHGMPPPDAVHAKLDRDPRVKAWAERVRVQGLVSTASRSMIVFIVGIEPGREARVSVIGKAVREGEYLDPSARNGILIGRRLADKLHTGAGKKVVLMSQQAGGDIGSGAFRVAGIFQTGNAGYDETSVYVLKDAAQEMLNISNQVTETAVVLRDIDDSDDVAADLRAEVDTAAIDVMTWKQLLPVVTDTIELTDRFVVPYYAIFYAAMAFGVLNTLLMAVGERTHEIGVMMAIGMTRLRVVLVILLESSMLALLAAAVGLAGGWGLVHYYAAAGIDLSRFQAGTEFMGVGHVIYPYLTRAGTAAALLAALAVALLTSLYPAIRAARLTPVEAIRTLT